MREKPIGLIFGFALSAAAVSAAPPPRTLRVDYFHTGKASEEVFSVDRVVREPLPWPGNPRRPLDDTNLGKYFFEVIDRASNRVLYSRGFASVYGEWETTGEAKTVHRTFSESLRFPEPAGPVQIVVKKRDAANAFREIWSFVLDPKDPTIDTALPPSPGPLIQIQKSGEPPEKVDFLILGDGYTAAERPKFEKDARRLAELLFAVSPFKERRSDFNVWALCPPSEESGISRPSTGVHRRSRVGATYDAFGSERYVLTFENRSFRDVASFAPYEFVEILTNTRTYGGGGIFGQYSTVAADSLWAPYVFVHEFGHHFAGLADEYFTSAVAYGPAPADRVEPWEPNATALLDPGNLKWKDLVAPGTPIPTPWKQAEFEKASREAQEKRRKIRAENRPEDEMDALFKEEQGLETRLLGTDAHSGKVGAFEGALYEARGYYRPQEDCIMFTRDAVPFCAVCRRAISGVVDLYTR
ncbi:MAG TPA: IgA Peptidase M64 [Thermoanaerobaculia bacterium]|nr:IgA Peptidase M64 [Thermoanaerobaculia bacterium]